MTTKETSAATKCPTGKGSDCTGEELPARQPGAVDIDQVVEDTLGQLLPLLSTLPEANPEFIHCMPPERPKYRKFSVFLAGSIEMGKAVQWQAEMALRLSHLPITVNNPRRGHWDPKGTQEAKNEAFRKQVEWELAALEQADVICFFFDVTTMSPVTMIELGLWVASKKVVVCCDKRFWRAGNVHIVCERYKVPLAKGFKDLPARIEAMLKKKGMALDSNGDLIGPNEHVPKAVEKEMLGDESPVVVSGSNGSTYFSLLKSWIRYILS